MEGAFFLSNDVLRPASTPYDTAVLRVESQTIPGLCGAELRDLRQRLTFSSERLGA